MPRRIGLLGGTFDPPHHGHLVVAVAARHQLGLDVVVLEVANEPWQKVGERAVTPPADRLVLTRALAPAVAGIEVGDREIRRGGPSYTADTVAALREEDPGAEVVLVVGYDTALGLPTWDRADELRGQVEVAVADRPGSAGPLPEGWSWCRFEIPALDISSTDLRARVADGRPLEGLTAPGVIARIAERGLYR